VVVLDEGPRRDRGKGPGSQDAPDMDDLAFEERRRLLAGPYVMRPLTAFGLPSMSMAMTELAEGKGVCG